MQQQTKNNNDIKENEQGRVSGSNISDDQQKVSKTNDISEIDRQEGQMNNGETGGFKTEEETGT